MSDSRALGGFGDPGPPGERGRCVASVCVQRTRTRVAHAPPLCATRRSLDDVFDGAYSPLDDEQVRPPARARSRHTPTPARHPPLGTHLKFAARAAADDALRAQVLNMFVDMELLAPPHGAWAACGAVAPLPVSPARSPLKPAPQHPPGARSPPPWASAKIAPLPAAPAASAPAPRNGPPAAESPCFGAPAAGAAPLAQPLQLPSGVYHYLGPVLPAEAHAALAAAGGRGASPAVFALPPGALPPPPGPAQAPQGQLLYVSAPVALAPAPLTALQGPLAPLPREGGACSSGGGGSGGPAASASLSLHSAAAVPAGRVSAGGGGSADAESDEQPGSARAGSAPGGEDTDARRERRIMANRRSAARSRLRKLQHTSEMEGRIARLEAAGAEAAARLGAARRAVEALQRGNGELRERAAALAQHGRASGWLVQPPQPPPMPMLMLPPEQHGQHGAEQQQLQAQRAQAHAQVQAAEQAAAAAAAQAASSAALLAALEARLAAAGAAPPAEREAALAALQADPMTHAAQQQQWPPHAGS